MDTKAATHQDESHNAAFVFDECSVFPVFQPIFDRAMDVFMFEALLRLKSDYTSFASVGGYVGALEATGQIALADIAIAKLVHEHIPVLRVKSVSLNVSLKTLSTHFGEYLDVVKALSKSAKTVIVELTETTPAIDYNFLHHCADEIRQCHALVAFDDAQDGHPYGHPDLIASIKPEILKIDGPFFHQAMEDEQKHAVLDSMIGACHQSGGKVVVEWVDSLQRYKEAMAVGADLTQGFLFGAPETYLPSTRSVITPLWDRFSKRGHKNGRNGV